MLTLHVQQGQYVSHKASSAYAPKVFAVHPKAARTRANAFKAAMQRLLDNKRIVIRTEGPPSKQRQVLGFPD